MGIAVSIIQLLIFIVEALLALRLILRLFAANPETPFVAWVYAASQPFLLPFAGILPSITIPPRFVLDLPTLVAMIAYSFIGYILLSLARPRVP